MNTQENRTKLIASVRNDANRLASLLLELKQRSVSNNETHSPARETPASNDPFEHYLLAILDNLYRLGQECQNAQRRLVEKIQNDPLEINSYRVSKRTIAKQLHISPSTPNNWLKEKAPQPSLASEQMQGITVDTDALTATLILGASDYAQVLLSEWGKAPSYIKKFGGSTRILASLLLDIWRGNPANASDLIDAFAEKASRIDARGSGTLSSTDDMRHRIIDRIANVLPDSSDVDQFKYTMNR
ncbi:MAG: hypothetical protein GXW98_05615 [Bifidobacterium crudilactis]|jgi:hypothetical protein|uniref:Uncharacterized protein n=1 Tax=Bifidobacterium crudilactis TaxID=327277 RepID=A0A971CZV7_9BIFI|nr:hypothetical protein [Bifidobacterium crudilactis]NLT79741.1 hypothetical protein [Bifidobacterium crudilactis]